MTRKTTPTTTSKSSNKVAYYAYHVRDIEGSNGYWTKVGVAFKHSDGKGLNLVLDVVPLNGQITLREPLPEKAE
jgi:hypothetical protein